MITSFFLFVCVCLEQTLNQKHVCQQPSRDSELKRLTGFDRESCSAASYPAEQKTTAPRALAESKGAQPPLTRRLRGRGAGPNQTRGPRGLLRERPPRMRGVGRRGMASRCPRGTEEQTSHTLSRAHERRLASGAPAGPGARVHGAAPRLCARKPAEPAISAIRAKSFPVGRGLSYSNTTFNSILRDRKSKFGETFSGFLPK